MRAQFACLAENGFWKESLSDVSNHINLRTVRNWQSGWEVCLCVSKGGRRRKVGVGGSSNKTSALRHLISRIPFCCFDIHHDKKTSGEGLFGLHFQVAVYHGGGGGGVKAGTPSKNQGETKPTGSVTRSGLALFLTQPRRTTTSRRRAHLQNQDNALYYAHGPI